MKFRYKLLPLITVAPIASFFGVTSCKDKDVEHEIKHVQNFSQLKHTIENQARQGQYNSKTIVIDQDIVCNETIYVMNDTTIVCNENHSIIRGVNFLDDMFVVGEDENGNNPILSGDKAILTLKTNSSSATLTIDGNKNGVTGDIHGSAIFVSNHSDVNFNDNVVIKDCKKDKNVRTLTKKISKPVTAGGAAVLIASGSFNMFGGLIDNCICPAEDGSEDKAYMGGAIYANNSFNMNGGTISNCSAARGGALYCYARSCLISGTITKCNAAKYGGFAYCPDNQYSNLILGVVGTSTNKLNIIENSCGASGGAIYGGHKSVIYSLGNCIFDGNIAANNGGAINSSGSILLDNTTLKNNKGQSSTSKGGAIYAYTSSATLAVRETQLTNCVFESNSSVLSGGAITLDAGSDEYSGAIGKITNCSFNKNTSGKGGAICVQERSNLTINSATFNQNEATATGGGAIYATSVSNTIIETVTATSNKAPMGGFIYITTTDTSLIIKAGTATGNISTATSPSGSTLWANTKKVVVKIKGKLTKQYFSFDGDVSGKAGFEVQDYEE